MSLFFDADWFDARLGERGLDRSDLAAAAGLTREELHTIASNEREPKAAELTAFAALLGADLIEVSLRSGVSQRGASGDDHSARLDELDARLDRIDRWLAELDRRPPEEERFTSPALARVGRR